MLVFYVMNHLQGFCSKRSVPDSLPRQHNQHHHLGVLGQVKEFHVYQNKLAKKMHWCMCILILIFSVQIPFADAKISLWRKCTSRTMWVRFRYTNKDTCDILKNLFSFLGEKGFQQFGEEIISVTRQHTIDINQGIYMYKLVINTRPGQSKFSIIKRPISSSRWQKK